MDWTVDTASMLLCHTPSHISAIVTVHTCGTGVRKENVMARVIQLLARVMLYFRRYIRFVHYK